MAFRKTLISLIIICSLALSLTGGIVPAYAAESSESSLNEGLNVGEDELDDSSESVPKDPGTNDAPADADSDGGSADTDAGDDFGDMGVDMTPQSLESQTILVAYDAIEQFVIRLYTLVHGRAYDEGGFKFWSNQLRSGRATGASVAHGFFFSPEFNSRPNINNDVYINILYNTLMNRSPDTGGFAYWSDRMRAGLPREDVFAGFVYSPEFTSICRNYGITRGDYTPPRGGMARVFATRLYRTTLQREPDLSGLNFWHNALVNGSTTGAVIAYQFIFSPEMMNRDLKDEQFVEILYNALMGRGSDAGGKAFWVNQLRNGNSRYSAFVGFVNSSEFDRICRDHGIIRGAVPAQANSMHGNNMVARIWNLMASAHFKGISDRPEHIAGIIGNLQSEAGSTLCPFQQELGNYRAGLGLMQWSYGRRTALESFMWSNGVSPEQFQTEMNKHLTGICTDPVRNHPSALLDKVLQLQINYMFHELTNTSERLYMSYINHPTSRTGSAGARAYAELFCVVVLRPGSGTGENNNIQDEGVQDALRASPYAGGIGELNRISYSGLSVRRDRAAQVYQQFN